MNPSVHLQEVSTGRRWIGCCPDGPYPGNFIRLGSGDFQVGRHLDCEIRLEHDTVSRLHALLRVVDESLFVLDKSTRNGTFVNNARAGDWDRVRPGDCLRFSSVEVKILWVGEGRRPISPEFLAWHDGTVVKVAAAIREGQSFGDLPILADALEDSGCTNSSVLDLFRGAERSDVSDYLLEQILATESDRAAEHIVLGRTMRAARFLDTCLTRSPWSGRRE